MATPKARVVADRPVRHYAPRISNHSAVDEQRAVKRPWVVG
jgi:hypothetical protein